MWGIRKEGEVEDDLRSGLVDRRSFSFTKEVNVGNLLTIIVVLLGMAANWFSLSGRVTTLENENLLYHKNYIDMQLMPAIQNINREMQALRQTNDDFPPHMHMDNGAIIYPKGEAPDTTVRGRRH